MGLQIALSTILFINITFFHHSARALSVMVKRKQAPETGILMILSPAKTLDLSPTDRLAKDWTTPDCDKDKTKTVASMLKKRKAKELEKMLGISSNLAKTAHQYWSTFELDPDKRSDLKPCIFSFSGAAYQGIQANECSDDAIRYMQQNLRIVDPLYGSLRPLDVMQPYRLEMATKKTFPDDEKVKMADYWKPSVCDHLSKDLASRDHNSMILLNLASDEYSAAVDESALPEGTKYIKVVFWEEGRTIAVHAKRARGLMVRYLAENAVKDLEAVQQFDVEGYAFVKDTSDEKTFVFNRKKQATAATKKSATAKKTSAEKVAEPAKKRTRRRS